jgi:hypothetical protein
VVFLDVLTEDKGSNGGKFDEDVDGWSRGILKWISDGITDNSGNLKLSKFSFLSLWSRSVFRPVGC